MAAQSESDLQSPEPLNEAIARWARLASPRLLRVLGVLATAGAGVVLVVDWHRWPIACLLTTLTAFAGWGLIEHAEASRRGLFLRFVQGATAVIGVAAAVLGVLGVLFWALGPAPIL